MNSFLFSAITLCLAAQCALAQYQSTPSYGYQPQRKMAPTPQTYQPQQQQQQSYAPVEQHYESSGSGYGQMESYGAKTGGYEAAPAATPAYGKQASGYSNKHSSSSAGYGQQSAGYAKAAPKYEEPYYPPMPFAWGYDINDGYGGAQYHKENGDEYGKRTGSYGYTDAYGIYRQVDYVADENGFRATIKTNEPGTANESPASVDLHAYEPPSNYYAGNQQQYQQQSSYTPSKGSSSYSAPAAAAAPAYSQPRSYSAPSSGYQQQQQQQYQSPRSYGASASKGYSRPQQQSAAYAEADQYLSSMIVPVYQKSQQAATPVVAAKPVVANKRAY